MTYLNKGYLYSLISMALLIVSLVFPLLALVDLIFLVLSAYYLYKGFSRLSRINKEFAPGKRGLILIFIGTPLAIIRPLSVIGTIIAFAGVIEYFRGLWRLSKLKGGELIRYGIVASATAYALGLLTFGMSLELYIVLETFLGSMAAALLYLGTKKLLKERPWSTRSSGAGAT